MTDKVQIANATRINWKLLIISYASLFIFGLIDNGRGPSYPRILEEFQLTPQLGSLFFTMASSFGLLAGLVARFWLPTIGPAKGMGIFCFFMAIGSLCWASSPWPSVGPESLALYIGAIFFGLGGGGSGICMNILVGKSVSLQYQKRAYGGLHSLYGISSFLSPVLMNMLVLNSKSWREYFYLISLFPFLLSLICFYWFFIKNNGQEKKELISTDKKHSTIPLPKKRFLLAACFGPYVAAEILVSTRLVYYLEDGFHYDKVSASNYLAIFFILLLAGRLSMLLLNLKGNTIYWMFGALFSTLLFFILGLFINEKLLVLTGLSMSIFFPMAMTYVNQNFQAEQSNAIITFIMNVVAFSVISMHSVTGIVGQQLGIEKIMWLGPICIIFSLILLVPLLKLNSSQVAG